MYVKVSPDQASQAHDSYKRYSGTHLGMYLRAYTARSTTEPMYLGTLSRTSSILDPCPIAGFPFP